MIEQEDNDELTAAYLAGCHDTRKAYEQRLAAAEAKNKELEAIIKSYRGSLVDRLMEYKAVSDE